MTERLWSGEDRHRIVCVTARHCILQLWHSDMAEFIPPQGCRDWTFECIEFFVCCVHRFYVPFNVNTCGVELGLCVCMYVCDIIHTCICMNVIFMNVCFTYELFWVFPVPTPVYHLWDHWGKTILSRNGMNTFRIHGDFFSSMGVTNTSHLLESKDECGEYSCAQTSSL